MSIYLEHHGIKGQKWGERHGPPYPLDSKTHARAKKAGDYLRKNKLNREEMSQRSHRFISKKNPIQSKELIEAAKSFNKLNEEQKQAFLELLPRDSRENFTLFASDYHNRNVTTGLVGIGALVLFTTLGIAGINKIDDMITQNKIARNGNQRFDPLSEENWGTRDLGNGVTEMLYMPEREGFIPQYLVNIINSPIQTLDKDITLDAIQNGTLDDVLNSILNK